MLHPMKQQEEAFPGTDLLPSQPHVVQRSFKRNIEKQSTTNKVLLFVPLPKVP